MPIITLELSDKHAAALQRQAFQLRLPRNRYLTTVLVLLSEQSKPALVLRGEVVGASAEEAVPAPPPPEGSSA